jgi:zinc protease
VTKDAAGLKDKLLSDVASPLTYDAPKPNEVLEEDKIISATKLNVKPENLRVTPVDEVFARDSGSELASHE